MKKLLTAIVLTVVFCFPFVCQVQASYENPDPLGVVWIAKVWDKNGDCEIRCRVLGNRPYQHMKAQRDFFPGMEVRYSKDGVYYDLISELTETGSSNSEVRVWLNGSVIIPQAHKVDFKIQVTLGYGRKGSGKIEQDYVTILRYLDEGILKPDPQYPDSQSITAFADCKFKNDAAKQQACEKSAKENIVRLFNEGTQNRNVWNWSNNNPPKIILKSSNVSGEWTAGTFTQTFEFGYEAKTNPDNSKSRTFEIELVYGNSICPQSEQFDFEVGKKTMKIVNTGVPQTITLSVPQNEVSRFSHMHKGPSPILINAFQWKVTEIIDGRIPIVRMFFIPVGSTLTIN